MNAANEAPRGPSAPVVLAAVFVIATCGLIYELIAGTVASYVLGDSVTQFSTIIGVYLFSMGVGSWLSRFIERNLVLRFIEIEIAVALLGGASSAVLFFAFAELSWFRVLLYALVSVIGTLVGLEIPLLMRILKDRYDLKELVARVLTADYLGALLASLAFPLFLMPQLGLVRGAFFVGALNACVAVACTYLFASSLARPRQAWFLRAEALASLALLATGFTFGDRLTSLAEEGLFANPIIYAESSQYQRIVVTEGKGGFQLYLNGNLQFASADEHRYHESLVHPAIAVAATSSASRGRGLRVLIMGGGDGLALREVLRHREVEAATLVDLDPAMTRLAARFPLLRDLNQRALEDPRVTVVNADAMIWIAEPRDERWDVVISDFPDPSTFTLGKLYTTRFYALVRRILAPGGTVAVQATSPMLARRSFWCIAETMETSGFFVRPYHAPVPSFGEWGYLLGALHSFEVPAELPEGLDLRFLTPDVMRSLFSFPRDMERVDVEPNRLNNQILVEYYEEEWARSELKTNRPWTVGALLLSMFMAALEATVVGTAMPTVVADLGGLALYGWVGAAYLLASTVSVPVYGKIADLHGRKRLLSFGIALFLAGSALSGFARSMTELIGARALQGLGAGAMQPIALTIVGDIFTLEERGRIQGLFGAVWGVSGVVGPLLGGLIVDTWSWHWVFWINIPFGFLAIYILHRAFHEERVKHADAPLDWRGAGLLTLGATALLLGASREHPAFTVPLGLALIIAFAFVERHARDPVLPLSLVLDRGIGVATIAGALLGATMMGTLIFVPLYAQDVLGATPTQAGATVTPMLVGWPIASALTSRMLVRTGFRAPVWLGSIVVAGSLVAFALLLRPGVSLFALQAAMFVYGAGMGLANTALIIAVQSAVAWSRRGVATATSMFARSMGGALGTGALGGLLAMGLERAPGLAGALAPLFWVLAAVAVLNLGAVAFYPSKLVTE